MSNNPGSKNRMRDPEMPQLIVTGLICFCAGGLYGWSALIAVLQADFAISTADAGFVFSVAIVAFTVSVLLTPYFLRGAPGVKRLAGLGLLASLSLCASALAPNFPAFVASFGIGFGAASGAIYICTLTLAAKTKRSKIVTPVMVASYGFGGAVLGPLWRVLVSAGWGLSALLVLAAGLAVASLVALSVRDQETDPTPAATEAAARSVAPSATLIALVWLFFATGSVGGLMVLGLASKILDVMGSSVGLSSVALAGIAIGNTSGRLSVAGFNQILNPISVAFLAALIGCAGLVLAAATQEATVMSLALMVVALGYGATASAVPSLTNSLFGPDGFARLFPLIFTAWGTAGLCAPWIAGAIFDRTGSFHAAVLAALGATALAAILALLLKKQSGS